MTTTLVNASKNEGVMVLELRSADIAMLEKADPYFKYDGAL